MAVEFQTNPDPLLFGRLMVYLGQVWADRKPNPERGSRFHVGAVVVNLTGSGRAGRDIRWPAAGLTTRLGVVERNLAAESADALLQRVEGGASRCLLPWVPLMTGGDDPGIIGRWRAAADGEPDARRKGELSSLVRVFAEAAGRAAIWESLLRGWNVRTSTVVDGWKLEERRDVVIEQLEEQFGPTPADLLDAINVATDRKRLREWVVLAASAADLAAFRAAAGV